MLSKSDNYPTFNAFPTTTKPANRLVINTVAEGFPANQFTCLKNKNEITILSI